MFFSLLFSFPFVILGVLSESPQAVAVGSVVLGVSAVAKDVRRDGIRGVTPSTIFALFSGILTGSANLVGLSAAGTEEEEVFFLYVVRESLFTSSLIAYLGLAFSLLGMFVVSRVSFPEVLPRINGAFSQSSLSRTVPLASFAILGSAGLLDVLALGTIATLVGTLPTLAVFLLAFSGWRCGKSSMVWYALVIAMAVMAHGLFFAFLRSAMVIPMLAFSLGSVLGARSLRPLRSRFMLPVYGAAIVFVAVFKAFGELRSTMGEGIDRVDVLRTADAGSTWDSVTAFASRFTSFNQLSQVAHLVERDGFYQGETLEYFAYAFVPRVLWSEKPIIAKGQWFAFQIGRAWESETGRYTNSINMTVPGELYLNFGWFGVAVGCLLVGGYFMLLWRTTRLWQDHTNNHLGQAFGFYLLLTGMSLGSDLQIVVTLTAMYLLFLVGSFVMSRSRRRAEPANA